MDAHYGSLEWLLAPITVKTFVDEYLEQCTLLVQPRSPDYFEKLLTLADFDGQLSSRGTLNGVRIVHEGREARLSRSSEASRAPTLEEVYAHYRKGATISLTHIHDHHAPLGALRRRLADTFSANIQVNAYLTPPASQGLGKHFDTHDVLVLQVHGSKKWRLGSRALRFPHRYQQDDRDLVAAVDFEQELDLQAG